jgi:C4-type Zn-finger protein
MDKEHKEAINNIMEQIKVAYQSGEYTKIEGLINQRNDHLAALIETVIENESEAAFAYLEEIRKFDNDMRANIAADIDDIAHKIRATKQIKEYQS